MSAPAQPRHSEAVISQTAKTKTASTNGYIPPLEPGGRLSRAEFERRYRTHPEIKKLNSSKELFSWPHQFASANMARPTAILLPGLAFIVLPPLGLTPLTIARSV